jgi:tight adherence protein B
VRRTFLVSALALLVAAPAAGAGVEIKRAQPDRYPHMTVTVRTQKPASRPPTVRENGRRVERVAARTLASDKSVVLALDRSRSMTGAPLAHAKTAMRRFVASKPRSDRLAIHAFATEALELTRFSTATIDADIALRDVAVDAIEGTALYDAIALGSKALAAETRGGARVLVVLTDGNEVSSKLSLAAAIRAARRAGVAVYPIAIESSLFSPAPLRRLAEETGGRYFGTASSASLGQVYESLASELARTWRIEYVTRARPGETAKVSASVPGLGTAETTVTLPGSGSAAGASRLVPGFLYDSALGTLLVAVLVGGLALLALVFAASARRTSWLRSRLEPHVKSLAGEETGDKTNRDRLALAAELFQATERSFAHLRVWKALERLVERADVPLRTVQILYVSVAAAFVGGLVAAFLAMSTFVILGVMGAGAAAPTAVVWRKAKKRTKAFENQLADLLLTIAASLKAGHSFKQGIQAVVDDGEPPASMEFKRVLTEIQLGRPMDDALSAMAERVGSANFDFVMTAVTIQRQVGGSLAGLFETVAETVRERQQFARKIKGLTAMGRSSAYVLVGLPFVLAGALTLLNPEYMTPLYTTSTGHILIAVGMGSMGIGSLILRKIVAFRV